MMDVRRAGPISLLSLTGFGIAGCTSPDGATGQYTVGGSLAGLTTGAHVVLTNNAADTLSLNRDGPFTFKTAVPYGGNYVVTVSTPPPGETCSVINGAGQSLSTSVVNVSVRCESLDYYLGGAVSGLNPDTQVTLQDNGTDSLTIAANGYFNLPRPLTYGTSHDVTVSQQPVGQTCTISMGSGATVANVSNIAVSCVNNVYSIGGRLTGLPDNDVLGLKDNGGDPLNLTANGVFQFSTPVASTAAYAVTVADPEPTGQTCTVSNGSGTVVGDPITDIFVTCVKTRYSIGGTLAGLAPFQTLALVNGNDRLVLTQNGPFSFPATQFYGSTYAAGITGALPQGETCGITGDTGTVTMPVTNIAVQCMTPPQFAYVLAQGADSTYQVVAFTINAGQLAPLADATVTTGPNPQSITLDPAFRHAYVANRDDGTVSMYAIGTDGSLAPLDTPTVAAGAGPSAVAIGSAGNAAYVVNTDDGTVSQYTIGSDGSLIPLVTPSVVSGTNPVAMAIDARGHYAYVVNQGENSVSQFSAASDGSLNLISTTPTGLQPISIALNPRAPYLYVLNQGDGTVSQFSVGPGSPTALSTGPIAVGVDPRSIRADPSGRFVYVANHGDNTVSEFGVASDGSLTPLVSPVISTQPAAPRGLAFDQTGQYLYVNSDDGSVTEFALDASGALIVEGSISAGAAALSVASAYPHN